MYTNKFVCIICSEALASNTMYTTLCGHVYHINCIENWIAQVKSLISMSISNYNLFFSF